MVRSFPSIRMRNGGLCTKSIRAIYQYFASFFLTGGSTLTSQNYNPSSVVYVSKPIRAIWRYLISKILCLALLFFISIDIFFFNSVIFLVCRKGPQIPKKQQTSCHLDTKFGETPNVDTMYLIHTYHIIINVS